MDGFAPLLDRVRVEPGPAARATAIAARDRVWWRWLRPWLPFLGVVMLPTLLAAGYYYLVAANQYQSEAHFLVRTNASNAGAATSGLGALLGLGGSSSSQSEAHTVEDYLSSHDAVAALNQKLDLVALFRRPEADALSRLHGGPAPAPESLLRYYHRRVKVTVSADSGIATLTVRAFRPHDAQAIAETLLELGEARVNSLNQRALEDSLSVAGAQLHEAEGGVSKAEGSVTNFRQQQRDIDPERTSSAQIQLATSLQERLSQQQAALSSLSATVGPDSPQRVALANEVRALQAQLAGVQAHLAGSRGAMAGGLGDYESLRLRQEFAAKRYEATAAALEAARTEALKQQMFVVRVVEPNLPVKALYPERLRIVATVFFGLLVSYAIGWLILAGVREHAA